MKTTFLISLLFVTSKVLFGQDSSSKGNKVIIAENKSSFQFTEYPTFVKFENNNKPVRKNLIEVNQDLQLQKNEALIKQKATHLSFTDETLTRIKLK